MNKKLPIKKIFFKGIKMPFERYKELIRLGWPYATLVLASSFISEEINGITLNIACGGLFFFTGVLGMVGCHRIFLLPTKDVAETSTVRWGYRETKFMFCLIGIAVLASIISAPIFTVFFNLDDFSNRDNKTVMGLVYIVLFIPVYYFISRWSLILPDSAIGNNRTLSWAWDISADYSFRVFILIGAVPLFTSFIFEIIFSVLEFSYILNLFQNSVWLIVAVIEICLLSLSYEWIVLRQEPKVDD